jgi:hypothetical protein
MRVGKVLLITGAILGILSLTLSLISPEFLGWYRIEMPVITLGYFFGVYISGIGNVVSVGGLTEAGISVLELIGGILVIIGAIICIIGVFKKLKYAGIIGGILMILGPLMLVLDLLIGVSEFTKVLGVLDAGDLSPLLGGKNVIFSMAPFPTVPLTWGLWIGFYVAVAGGVLGLIGGVVQLKLETIKGL